MVGTQKIFCLDLSKNIIFFVVRDITRYYIKTLSLNFPCTENRDGCEHYIYLHSFLKHDLWGKMPTNL
jgi:hypothetical protein